MNAVLYTELNHVEIAMLFFYALEETHLELLLIYCIILIRVL